MIEKKTIVDQVEVTRDWHVQVRFGLLLVEDGVEIDCKWHRTTIEPGGDVDLQMALVNEHLSRIGKAEVSAEGIERVKAVARAAHTPEVVAQYQDERFERLKQLAGEK